MTDERIAERAGRYLETLITTDEYRHAHISHAVARALDMAAAASKRRGGWSGYGVGWISEADAGEPVAYINAGDTYTATVLWSDSRGFFVGSWGDVVEGHEAERAQAGDIRCGYCGEYTPTCPGDEPGDWRGTVCDHCDRFVDNGETPRFVHYCGESGAETVALDWDQVRACSHAGPCDDDVADVADQVELIADAATVRDILSRYGAWTPEELAAADPLINAHRMIWLAACDIAEHPASYRA